MSFYGRSRFSTPKKILFGLTIVLLAAAIAGAVYLTDLKQLEGHVPARAIHGGTVLTPAMLTTPAVMQSGSPITLIMRTGAIEVKTDGFAMQKGRIGARIRVRNAKSGKMLRGKVIDANTVEIEG